ncbi:unnamed protein product [Rotaria sordida]|uniref:Retropepsins domain-containing protein n=1 Tax=Rotaria sordida TaxID=392033 RepID=A0A815PJ47_9BILA|nr:unnamed protein product [Rotaria sordida]CAF4120365.1 unnamed protein product [Rotaria sordida]
MIDTGAQYSFINEEYFKSNAQLKYSSRQHQKFFLADEFTSFIVTGIVNLNIHVDHIITTISPFVTKNLCTNFILDMDYLSKYDIDVQPMKKTIIFNFNNKKIIFPMNAVQKSINLPIRLLYSTRIAPQSAQKISVNVIILSAILVFHPSFKFLKITSIYTRDSFLNVKNYTMSLTIINSSNFPCYLRKGFIIENHENLFIQPLADPLSNQLNTITKPSQFTTSQP